MEQDELRTWEYKCIQEEPPECTATCPIHVDARAFVREMGRGDIEAAFAVLARVMPFPGILARVCDHPCELRCKRGDVDEPIAIGLLEQACIKRATGVPRLQLLPRRPQKVAVLGGGLAGMTVAFDLRKKGYTVTVFEPSGRLGGSLWDLSRDALPEEAILGEAARLLDMKAKVLLGEVVDEARFEQLRQEYDAVFVDRDAESESGLPLARDERGAIVARTTDGATGLEGVFAGGGTRALGAFSPVGETYEGRRGALSIERFLQKASMTAGREREGAFATRLFTSIEEITPALRVAPADPAAGFSDSEILAEAGRCIQCECMECTKVCLYLERYSAYPKKYARQVFGNERVVMGAAHTKNQFVNSCTDCALCETVCPNSFHMGDLCLQARQTMNEKKFMPASFHEFALQDFAHSGGPDFALARNEPGTDRSAWLYFPSCQLAASSPAEVLGSYRYLRERLEGGVGIFLGCCGVPAKWAGRDDLFEEALGNLRQTWESMGRPRLIAACSNCLNVFREHLPESEPVSLWRIVAEKGLPVEACPASGSTVSIADPCTSRHDRQLQDDVRQILHALDIEIEELPLSGELAECCGYGGLVYNANPKLAEEIIAHRVKPDVVSDPAANAEPFSAPPGWYRTKRYDDRDTAYYRTSATDRDYIAYCAMCRDNFAGAGKRISHLIELIFPAVEGGDPAGRGWISWSDRRANRVRVKRGILRELGEEGEAPVASEETVRLQMAEDVRRTIDGRRILEEDLRAVIDAAEKTSRWLTSCENGHRLANLKLGNVTFWVEYAPEGDGYVVYNAYSHRMNIIGVKP